MIAGTLSSSRLSPAEPDGPIGIITSPSVDGLICDLSSGRCDVVLLPDHLGALEAEFAAVCLFRPAATVWVRDVGSKKVRPLASGRFGPRGSRTDGLPASSLRVVRLTWLHAWTSWVGTAAQETNGDRPVSGLPRGCFLDALINRKTAGLDETLSNGGGALRRRLSQLGLRGPKRFEMAAYAFQAWEYARLGTWSAERSAYQIGLSTLSSLDRSLVSTVGLPATHLAQLTDSELIERLVRALRRPASQEKQQIAAKTA